MESAIAWLNVWWPLMALPGSALAGLAMGLWFGREDRLQLKRNWERAVADSAASRDELVTLRATTATYKRDWQALRAIVEQHTVKQENA